MSTEPACSATAEASSPAKGTISTSTPLAASSPARFMASSSQLTVPYFRTPIRTGACAASSAAAAKPVHSARASAAQSVARIHRMNDPPMILRVPGFI